MLNVGCESGLRNRGILNRGMSHWVQETEQEDSELRDVRRQEAEQEGFKHRDESGDRTQNGEDLKEGAGDFVVFTCESIIFAGSIAQVKEFGSLIKRCNICS